MLPEGDENLGLHNFLTNVKEQGKDLLGFRSIGQQEFETHIFYRILHTPSTDAPRRRKQLKTSHLLKQARAN